MIQKIIPSFPTYLNREEQLRVAATDVGWVIHPLDSSRGQQPTLLSVHRGLKSFILSNPQYSTYLKYVKDATPSPTPQPKPAEPEKPKEPKNITVAGIPFEIPIPLSSFDLSKVNPLNATAKVSSPNKNLDLNFDPGRSIVTGSLYDVGVNTITIDLTDNTSGSIQSISTTVDVIPNPRPTVANEIPVLVWTCGIAFNFTIPENVFFDSAHGDKLTYTVEQWDNIEFPEWIKFDGSKHIGGIPTEPQTICVGVKATDLAGGYAITKLIVVVAEPSEIEVAELKPEDEKLGIAVGAYYEFDARKLFKCNDAVNKLTFGIEKWRTKSKAAPKWLKINETTGKVTGTPTKPESFQYIITATDLVGRRVVYGPIKILVFNAGGAK